MVLFKVSHGHLHVEPTNFFAFCLKKEIPKYRYFSVFRDFVTFAKTWLRMVEAMRNPLNLRTFNILKIRSGYFAWFFQFKEVTSIFYAF